MIKVIKYHGIEFLPISDVRLQKLGTNPPETVEEDEVRGMAIGLIAMRGLVQKTAENVKNAPTLIEAQTAVSMLLERLAEGD